MQPQTGGAGRRAGSRRGGSHELPAWRAAMGSRPDAVDRLRSRLRLHLRAVRAVSAATGRSAQRGGDGGGRHARSARVPDRRRGLRPRQSHVRPGRGGLLRARPRAVRRPGGARAREAPGQAAGQPGVQPGGPVQRQATRRLVRHGRQRPHALRAGEPAGAVEPGPSGAQAGWSRAVREPHASRRGARNVSRDSRARRDRGRAALSAAVAAAAPHVRGGAPADRPSLLERGRLRDGISRRPASRCSRRDAPSSMAPACSCGHARRPRSRAWSWPTPWAIGRRLSRPSSGSSRSAMA